MKMLELAVFFLIGMLAGAVLGYMATRMHYEEEIVARGYGSFKIDRIGNEHFEWNKK